VAYEVHLTPKAARQYKKLPKQQQPAIKACIDSLAEDPRPHGCESLQGYPYYRVRVGNYRVVYDIKDGDLHVMVVLVGNRRDIYEALRNL
jgi:mRNA interferase RelE/StbE